MPSRRPLDPDPVPPRRAGRPQRLPVDANPVGSTEIDGPRRMAWLLATSRLLAPDTATLSREEFMARLRTHGLTLDASRLSRLESGAQRGSLAVLAAYEEQTILGRGVLPAVDSLVSRTSGEQPVLRHVELEPRELDGLVECAAAGRARASDWLCLAAALVSHERIYMPASTWAQLSTRLLSELSRSIGPEYVVRHEAAVLLLSHEQVRGHVTKSVGRFVMDPHVQSVTPALTLLAEVADDAAADLVVRLMGARNPLLRHGATGVAATLGSRGGLDAEHETWLEHHVGSSLARGGPLVRRIDALELASELPAVAFDRVLASTKHPVVHRRATMVRRQQELVEPDVARSVSEAAASRAERIAGRPTPDPDVMLARLLREALFHLRRERRHLAAAVLGASHYAPMVAEVVLDLASGDDEIQAATSWALLRRLGHVLTREQVAPRVMAESRPDIHPRALVTLALCRGPLPPGVSERLARDAVEHRLASVRHAAVSVLGMAGDPALGRLGRLADVASTREGATWWLATGSAVGDDLRVG